MALWQPRGSRHQHGPKAHDGQMGPVPAACLGSLRRRALQHPIYLVVPVTIPIASHACPIVQRLPWGHGNGIPPSPSAWHSLDGAVQRVLQGSPRCVDSSGDAWMIPTADGTPQDASPRGHTDPPRTQRPAGHRGPLKICRPPGFRGLNQQTQDT